MKIIKFRRISNPIQNIQGTNLEFWEIAFSQKHLNEKLNGELAEVIMPAESIFVQFWRKIFPLKELKAELGKKYILIN